MNTALVQTPAIIIVLGATGDLAAKKIFPSLWHLFKHDRLPQKFSVIGVARRDFSDGAFRAIVKDAVLNHGGISDDLFDTFLTRFEYHTASFEDADAFQSLSKRITERERAWGVCGNKLFYLAVPPSAYEEIFKNLAGARLNEPCGGELGWSRVLIEKPFGSDEKSAQKLQQLLAAYFKEDQIYRIDHYLFKEIVQGIEHFRFSNNLFESTWDSTTIERIDIRLLEKIGVEDRGAFYDGVGTLRDVGQNHLLAMLAAITQDPGSPRDIESMRESRAHILQRLSPWTLESIRTNTFRAQHEGYQAISGVKPGSKTETYFALKTELMHPRWRGIPITLEAGKSMGEARKEIVLTLKHPRICLLCEAGAHGANTITFRLEPNDEIIIHFWTKKPGFERQLEERTFSFFLYEKETKVQYVEEYAKVLNAAFLGNRALFVSDAEIGAMWKFVDPILDAWRNDTVPLASYQKGTKPEPLFLTTLPDKAEEKRGSLGIIGLGKMGGNMARRLVDAGWHVAGYNAQREITDALVAEGLDGAFSLLELASKLPLPRLVWLMVPHTAVDTVLNELTPHLSPGDIIVDGGNSLYSESVRRNKELAEKGLAFLDIGVSGGPGGARTGACMMVGGKKETFQKLEDAGFFKDMCVQDGWGYMGESGSGHYTKMVHNGIEYGMMQSIAEGFDLLKHSKEFSFDLAKIADVYSHGSVIVSRLISWIRDSYQAYGSDLTKISGSAASSGEGAWTIETGTRDGIQMPAIQAALDVRKASEKNPSYQGRIISALRGAFGQHPVSRGNSEPEIL